MTSLTVEMIGQAMSAAYGNTDKQIQSDWMVVAPVPYAALKALQDNEGRDRRRIKREVGKAIRKASADRQIPRSFKPAQFTGEGILSGGRRPAARP